MTETKTDFAQTTEAPQVFLSKDLLIGRLEKEIALHELAVKDIKPSEHSVIVFIRGKLAAFRDALEYLENANG